MGTVQFPCQICGGEIGDCLGIHSKEEHEAAADSEDSDSDEKED